VKASSNISIYDLFTSKEEEQVKDEERDEEREEEEKELDSHV
jgi:hypothetical protein